jgi:hypothetical protein
MMEMVSAAFGRVVAARRRRRSWQIVDGLQDLVRKDIGLPPHSDHHRWPTWMVRPYR